MQKQNINIKGIFAILLLVSFQINAQKKGIDFTIDLISDTSKDTILVTAKIQKKIPRKSNIFQFASTAPGAYQTMNMGRFVNHFKAFDKRGNEIETEKINVNQYYISKPRKVSRIEYKIAETWDTPVKEYPIHAMCGSSLESDHAYISLHTVIGYFEGTQNRSLSIQFLKPPSWKIGTALKDTNGKYYAKNFDHAVDSPFLLGKLTTAEKMVSGTNIEIYTYSQNDKINSKQILNGMSKMILATEEFLQELPVDRYVFLYHFEPNTSKQLGAWEHSYSSQYVLQESEPTEPFMKQIQDLASHEFFHIVTPLNIHSEVIEEFNFKSPVPSQHLWLYEGVTEWASKILQFRAGLVNFETFLEEQIKKKIQINKNYFNPKWSLKQIADKSFTEAGAREYGNIYFKGALTALFLDIELLELSNGELGLRELLQKLIKKYGKGKPVSEENFINDLVEMTYPEIRAFFDECVYTDKELPYDKYLEKIGIVYEQKESSVSSIKIYKTETPTPMQEKLFNTWKSN
ncbi:hypothetical protein [uncultured Psychroserpens sp.]|uniref:M61 family metallopeptidase n=1 Tax=uncultured Psychroserpens sp. TaxID=255436 RepID=UPI00260DD36E|nr:hypothetical protein [uncultured Psychroserpens sp.]